MKKRISKRAVGYWGAILLYAVYRVGMAFLENESLLQVLNIPGIILNTLFLEELTTSTSLKLLLETLISTIVIIFTGEFIPKALFRANPNGALKRFAIIYRRIAKSPF